MSVCASPFADPIANPFDVADGTNPLRASAVARWGFDETSGSVADSIGSLHMSATNSPGSAVGLIGNCRTLVAASSQRFLRTSNSGGTFDFLDTAWTMIGQVKLSSKPSNAIAVGTNVTDPFQMRYTSALNRLSFQVNGASGTHEVSWTSAPSTGVWYTVCFGYDPVADVAFIGVDAGTRQIVSHTGGLAAISSGNVFFGASGTSSYWDGSLDEFVLFNKVLSVDEEKYARARVLAGKRVV